MLVKRGPVQGVASGGESAESRSRDLGIRKRSQARGGACRRSGQRAGGVALRGFAHALSDGIGATNERQVEASAEAVPEKNASFLQCYKARRWSEGIKS